ncbi:hypothetical protein O5Y58_07430 [Microbacterium paraoxydans]|uniref:hypothetical protein n=1 Tax=Microbacterium paraoxydans TaxID=199592 RepID=UPI00352F32CD
MTDTASYPNQGTLRRAKMRFERDFTQLPNTWLRDKRISRGARGLLAELMTHDVGYDVSLQGLAAMGTEGKDALRRMVTELEHFGYLSRHRARAKGKFGGTTWTLMDPFEAVNNGVAPKLPGLENPRSNRGGFPNVGKTYVGSTASENPTTKEDQLKNKKTPVLDVTTGEPVDNSRVQRDLGSCGHVLIDDRHCERGCSAARVQGAA